MSVDHGYAFPEHHQGMDHEHYDWAPLNASRVPRACPSTPGWPVRHRRHGAPGVEPAARQLSDCPLSPAAMDGAPFPDVIAWSHREYGHRVGIFRVLDVLARHGAAPGSVAAPAPSSRHSLARTAPDRSPSSASRLRAGSGRPRLLHPRARFWAARRPAETRRGSWLVLGACCPRGRGRRRVRRAPHASPSGHPRRPRRRGARTPPATNAHAGLRIRCAPQPSPCSVE